MNAIHARSQLRYWPTFGKGTPNPSMGAGSWSEGAEARQLAAA